MTQAMTSIYWTVSYGHAVTHSGSLLSISSMFLVGILFLSAFYLNSFAWFCLWCLLNRIWFFFVSIFKILQPSVNSIYKIVYSESSLTSRKREWSIYKYYIHYVNDMDNTRWNDYLSNYLLCFIFYQSKFYKLFICLSPYMTNYHVNYHWRRV